MSVSMELFTVCVALVYVKCICTVGICETMLIDQLGFLRSGPGGTTALQRLVLTLIKHP